MDWQNNINQALDYIEDNLTSDIDYSELAKIMSCSDYEFRRMFSFITQIPLSEYIICRRLTMAAEDIKKGTRVIDVAIKYKYESQSAFSRAFTKFHGVTPSLARGKDIKLNSFPRLFFKLVLMEDSVMKKKSNQRTNIIGSGEVNYAVSIDLNEDNIQKSNKFFWDTKGNDVIGTTSLPMYGAFVSEEKHHLFGDVSGKKILEIGCGRGDSLKYHAEHKAGELWGIDISEKQIEKADVYLKSCGVKAKLICSSMETECGIPKDYFDESWYSVPLDGGIISLSDRKLSTYINALTKSGFIIDEMLEESDDDILSKYKDSEFARKAEMLPVTFVIKARKL